MDIQEKEKKLISDFEEITDWVDKYNYIIDAGKSLPEIDSKFKTQEYLIPGCQSQVWLHASLEDGKVIYRADSDALITRGIVALLIQVLSGHPPQDILDSKLEFIDRIGLQQHLSPTRSNGLANMVKQMKLYALAFKARTMGNKS